MHSGGAFQTRRNGCRLQQGPLQSMLHAAAGNNAEEVPRKQVGGMERAPRTVCDQQVLRLDVPVDDAVLVAPVGGFDELVDVEAHVLRVKAPRVLLQDFEQRLFDVLKYQVLRAGRWGDCKGQGRRKRGWEDRWSGGREDCMAPMVLRRADAAGSCWVKA